MEKDPAHWKKRKMKKREKPKKGGEEKEKDIFFEQEHSLAIHKLRTIGLISGKKRIARGVADEKNKTAE